MDTVMLAVLSEPEKYTPAEVKAASRKAIKHIQMLESSLAKIHGHVQKAAQAQENALADLEQDLVGGARDEIRLAHSELKALYEEKVRN